MEIMQVPPGYEVYFLSAATTAKKLVATDVNLLAAAFKLKPESADLADCYYSIATFFAIFPEVYKLLVTKGKQEEADYLLLFFQNVWAKVFDGLGFDVSIALSLKKRE